MRVLKPIAYVAAIALAALAGLLIRKYLAGAPL